MTRYFIRTVWLNYSVIFEMKMVALRCLSFFWACLVGPVSFSGVSKSWQLPNGHYLRQGVAEGPFTTYYPNGRLHEEGAYLRGQLHGVYTRYDTRGVKRLEAPFTHGKLDGWFYQYDRNGTVEVKCFYSAGGIVSGEQHYRADGTLAYEYIPNKDHNHLVTKSLYDKAGQWLKFEKVERMPLSYHLFGAQAHE